ncbi:MAG: helix-turn-helix transcriptional regulator [Clostridia bacterium]|jgi:DNA-binding PadR family transcriptional regulator|nr:helix-turn-helix transcriptional regulator [Clostridia bacterium]
MALSADLLRGYTDTIILNQLLDSDSYGYEITKRISEQSHGALELKEATLYTAFRRMENGGYIISYWGNEGSGARRRYYSITVEGRNRLAEDLLAWKETRGVLNTLLGDGKPRTVLHEPKENEIPVIRVEE